MRFVLVMVLSFLGSLPGEAAVVVLCNYTGEAIKCKVTVGDADPVEVQLAVGESKPVTCGRNITLTFTNKEGEQYMKLEPYTAYLFQEHKKAGIEFKTAGLVGNSIGVRDIPVRAPVVKPIKITVKLLVDDAERRTKPVWSASLKKRLAEASEIMTRQAGVSFEAVEAEEWKPDAKFHDMNAILVDFERQVAVKPAALAIGFTSREFAPQKSEIPFAVSHGMFSPHILIRENEPRAEPERVEVLVQQLGRYLGAVVSPDPISCMRSKLGDGKAILARFRIGFDPLNLLAINIVADEYRNGAPKKLADWPQEAQVRLARIYGTLNAATPEEPLNEEVMALLDRAGLRPNGGELKPMPMEPKAIEPSKPRELSGEQDAIRKVVKAIVLKADENSRKPANERVKGDDLAQLYIRTAADVADGLEPELRKKAFLIALGIALDDSEVLRSKPVIGDLCKAIESDDERKKRLIVLGNPTMRYRRDLCQHFVISATLTAILGVGAAEAAGLFKEQQDMKENGSGFSFCDLAADYAGVALADQVLDSGETLKLLREKFTVSGYMPKVDDLPEGLSKAKFEAVFGSISDKRFQDMVGEVRERVKELKK